MAIRLIALDIDGTLLDARGALSARNRAAIEDARARGVHVVLVTGRRFGSAHLLLRELGLDVPLVAHNGALTKDTVTLETTDVHPLPVETASEVIRVARAVGVDVVCCCDEPRGLGKMVIEAISGENPSLRRYLDRYRDAVVDVEDLLAYVEGLAGRPPLQLLFSGRCAPMDDLAVRLQAALPDDLRVFRTRYPSVDLTILDAVSARASKGACVATIAGRLGLSREEVMAVGDNHNDLTMLEYAGVGVVMGNAEEELKALGFFVTASNEESGVADAIARHVLL